MKNRKYPYQKLEAKPNSSTYPADKPTFEKVFFLDFDRSNNEATYSLGFSGVNIWKMVVQVSNVPIILNFWLSFRFFVKVFNILLDFSMFIVHY